MARSIASTSERGIRPRAHAPTASNASMIVTCFSDPSESLAMPGMIVPA